jgi:hypothetical protein
LLGFSGSVELYNKYNITLLPDFSFTYAFLSTDINNTTKSEKSKSLTIEMIAKYSGKKFGFYISPGALINLYAVNNSFSFGLNLGVTLNFDSEK